MSALARGNGESGALLEMSGTIANNATWAEDIYFTEAGVATNLTGLSFKLTFRADPESDSADLTLSTTAGTLSIVEDTDAGVNRILRITVPPATLRNYSGDYKADLASQDGASVVTLWASGTVTFRPNPVQF